GRALAQPLGCGELFKEVHSRRRVVAAVERVAAEAAVGERDPADDADELELLERCPVLGLGLIELAEQPVDLADVVLCGADPNGIPEALFDLEGPSERLQRGPVSSATSLGDA